MPNFRITLPDGRIARITGDDPDAAAEAAAEFAKANPLKGVEAFKAEQRGETAKLDAFRKSKQGQNYRPDLDRAGAANVLNGASLGLFGQGEALLMGGITGAKNLVSRIQGKEPAYSARDAYVGQRQLDNEAQRQFSSEHPVASLTTGLAGGAMMPGMGMVGNFVKGSTGAKVGVRSLPEIKALLQSAGIVPTIGRSALAGAAMGAASGAMTADPGKMTEGAVRGGEMGAAFGAAIPAAAAAGGAVASRIIAPAARTVRSMANRATGGALLDPVEEAATRLGLALRKDGASPEIISQAMTAWRATGAPPAALMDIAATLPKGGQNTLRLLRAAGSSGPASNIATGRVDQLAADLQDTAIGRTRAMTPDTRTAVSIRNGIDEAVAPLKMDAPNRIVSDARDVLGIDPRAARGDIEAAVSGGQSAAKPLYETARSTPGGIWNDDLAAVSQRPEVKTALSEAATDVRNAGRTPTHQITIQRQVKIPGGGVRTESVQVDAPTAEVWDLAKKNLGRQVERDSFGRALPDSQSQGNHNIGQASSSLSKSLRDAIPGYGEALDKAGEYMAVRGAYEQTKGALLDSALPHADFKKMWDGLALPQQQSAQAAIANDIFDLAQNGKLVPGTFKTPSVRAKLETAFGPKAGGFIDRVEQEAALAAGQPVTGASGARGALSDQIAQGAALDSGLGVLNAAPDEFAANIAKLDPAARETMKVGLRQAITDAIGRPTEGSTGLLNRLSTATNMRRNLTAAFGEDEAGRYMDAIGKTVDQLKNARFISPNTGSVTAAKLEDEGLVSLPTSKTGLVLALINKLKSGAVLTDAERAAILELGVGGAEEGAARVAPRLVPKPRRPEILPYFSPNVGAYAGRSDR